MTALTILFADDNPNNLMLVRLALRDQDYRILEASNGQMAVETVKREHPDMIFMDISMPEMNGLEATRYLKSLPEFADTPIIALTSNTMPGDREACLAAGCVAYLMKPVMRHELLRAITTFGKPADTPKTDAPRTEITTTETPKLETPKAETPNVETPKAEAPKVEEPTPPPVVTVTAK